MDSTTDISISEKVTEHRKKLESINSVISTLNVRAGNDYLAILGSIPDFDSVFGFGGTFDIFYCKPSLHVASEDPSFVTALRNIFRRRVYFYLAEFCQDFAPALKNRNVKLLLDEFKKYRRVNAYGYDEVISYFGAIDGSKPYTLAPLYETFVDSELFTTLVHLEGNLSSNPSTQWPGAKDWPNRPEFTQALVKRLSSILGDSISDDFRIQDSIKDESNILWGIRLLYQIQKDRFAIGNRFQGKTAFHELVKNLASRPMSKRKHPQPKDLVLEITPELRTLERTNLYSALNLIELFPMLNDSREAKVATRDSIEAILKEYIFEQELARNLYFVCLKYRCLLTYSTMNEHLPTTEFQERSPTKEKHTDNMSPSYQTIVYGNVTHLSTGDMNVSQATIMQVIPNDFDSLRRALVDHGVAVDDIDDLKTAVSDDPPPTKPNSFGKRVSAWTAKMLSKAASGAWKISTDVAAELLGKVLSNYYGLK